MKKLYATWILYALLSNNALTFTSAETKSKENSLKQALSFINETSGQSSPVFDISTKPRFEYIITALDKIIQKSIDDKTFLNKTGNQDSALELSAHQQKDIVQQLYQQSPDLFLSDAELQKQIKETKTLTKAVEASAVADSLENVLYAQMPPDYAYQYEQEEPTAYASEPSGQDYAEPYSNIPYDDYPDQIGEYDGEDYFA